MLIDVLRKCGKHEMSEKIHGEYEKYNNEKTKIATGTIYIEEANTCTVK
jgi:hypothetical protein